MLSALGHSPTIAIRDFSGEATFDPCAPQQARLQMRIRANSLEVTDDIKASDRKEIESTMNQKVLASAQYPEIVFETTGVSADLVGEGRYLVELRGELTLRGVTRDVPLTAQVMVTGDVLRASGEFAILQTDFGIQPVSVAGGAVKLKDQLRCTFDIVSRRQV
jgi:polyisoprenoid-binding protein YceI